MKSISTTLSMLSILLVQLLSTTAFAQTGKVKGQLQNNDESAASYATVMLYNATDSTMAKIEATDEAGIFQFQGIAVGEYYLLASYIGAADLTQPSIMVKADETTDLGVLTFGTSAIELEGVTVVEQRVMVEVKADRTVFNVEGTINSTGDDAMSLMRKAPGVMVDNNDNIVVLGRSGVQVFIDGKQLPLGGEDLSNYLKSIPSDQIDRIDIITNPGAKYDAEGNAGIIDIRLKKDKNLGMNGTVRGNITQGRYFRMNGGVTGNYRNKKVNVFGSLNAFDGENFSLMSFESYQNDLLMDEVNKFFNDNQNINYRAGADFFISPKSTIGFLTSGMFAQGNGRTYNDINISTQDSAVDSILIANSTSTNDRVNQSFNLNYAYDDRKKQRTLNIDLDYGLYSLDATRYQPNIYYDPTGENVLSTETNWFDTPSDIQIYTFKVDFENPLLGGKLGVGTKYSRVISDNTFLLDEDVTGERLQNDSLSNTFKYDEAVYAGYLKYDRQITQKVSISAGLRAELTDATGDLRTFRADLAEPPVELNYWRFFPSVGLSYQHSQMHMFSVNYGRRINRPDYNVLNPFNNRLSQLSYERGNPNLQPEIVNNYEIGYTMGYRYNFKLSYSETLDQITRLIGPDDSDPRATFISWENLSKQRIINFNISAPMQLAKKWNLYFNGSASRIHNEADYRETGGGIVDVTAYTYNFYMQNTFTLPYGIKAEVSGWFSGPGVWGGVFLYNENWSLNLGLQKRFLNDKLNVRLSANDIFFKSGWNGYSEYNGLRAEGFGYWDSRTISLSMSYNFGNQNVKRSRRRKTGLESEAGRVQGD